MPLLLNLARTLGKKTTLLVFIAICCIVYILLSSFSANPQSLGSFRDEELHRQVPKCEERWEQIVKALADGTYELRLPIDIDANSRGRNQSKYVPESSVKASGGNSTITYEDFSKINDGDWKRSISKEIYNMYPQDLPINEIVMNLSSCKSISEIPINKPSCKYLRVSSTVCPPTQTGQHAINIPQVVILVKSWLHNFPRRQRFRKFMKSQNTLQNFSVQFVFSVGLPKSSRSHIFQRDGFSVSVSGRYKDLIKKRIYARTIKELQSEAHQYDDLIVGNYEDTYHNLTRKLVHSYSWAAHFCQHAKPFFLFIDDEYQVNITYLHQLLRQKNETEKSTLALGVLQCRMSVMRYQPNGRGQSWLLSKREMPWPIFACYVSGFSTLLSYNVVKSVSLGMLFTKEIHVDDAYLGLVMSKFGFSFKNEPNMYMSRTNVTENKFVFPF